MKTLISPKIHLFERWEAICGTGIQAMHEGYSTVEREELIENFPRKTMQGLTM